MSLTNVKARLSWVDATRAFCVIAVVLGHFQSWLFDPTYDAYPDEMLGWYKVANFLVAFRMPALFAVSGLLVASRVREGWSDRRNGVRAASSFYLYAVWWAVLSVFLAFYYWSTEPLLDFLTQFFFPQSALWFILFLAINVVVLTTLHRVNPVIVLGSLAVLSALMLAFGPEGPWVMVARGAYYMLFFAIGVYFKSFMMKFVSGGLWWKIPAMVITVIVISEGFRTAPFRSVGWIGLYLGRDLSAVFCAIAITAALCLIRPVSAALSYLGRRTLIIYVLHIPLILLAVNLRNAVAGETFDVRLAWQIGPAVGTMAIVVACLIIGNLLERSAVGRAFLDMPTGLKTVLLGGRRKRLKGTDVAGTPESTGGSEEVLAGRNFKQLEMLVAPLPGVEVVAGSPTHPTVRLQSEITDSQLEKVVEALRALELNSVRIDARESHSNAIAHLLTIDSGSAQRPAAAERAEKLRDRILAQWS